MLTETRRQQLDDIVGKMIENKETEEDIKFVVGDFKRKYDTPKGFEKSRTPQEDVRSAEKYGAAFPLVTGQDNPLTGGLKALGNLPGSAARNAKEILIDAPIGLAKLLAGGITKGFAPGTLPEAEQSVDALSGLIAGGIEKLIPGTQEQEKIVNTFMSELKKDYGSLDALARTSTNDPFGFGLKVYLAMRTAAGVAGKGAEFDELTSKTGQLVTKPVDKYITQPLKDAAQNLIGNKTLIGAKNAEVIEATKNHQARQFVQGKKLSSTAQELDDAVTEFERAGMEQLKSVKDQLPNANKIPVDSFKTAINKGIKSSLKSDIEYHGISGKVDTIDDIINKGILTDQEAKLVNNAVTKMNNWSDLSTRGVLNAKEYLENFVKGTEQYLDSDAIIRSMQRSLKSLAADNAGTVKIKEALLTASEQIDKAQTFRAEFLGKTVTATESKLSAIASKFDNPALLGDKIDTLKDLESLTGHNIYSQLEGYNKYLKLFKFTKEEPGMLGGGIFEGPLTELQHKATLLAGGPELSSTVSKLSAPSQIAKGALTSASVVGGAAILESRVLQDLYDRELIR